MSLDNGLARFIVITTFSLHLYSAETPASITNSQCHRDFIEDVMLPPAGVSLKPSCPSSTNQPPSKRDYFNPETQAPEREEEVPAWLEELYRQNPISSLSFEREPNMPQKWANLDPEGLIHLTRKMTRAQMEADTTAHWRDASTMAKLIPREPPHTSVSQALHREFRRERYALQRNYPYTGNPGTLGVLPQGAQIDETETLQQMQWHLKRYALQLLAGNQFQVGDLRQALQLALLFNDPLAPSRFPQELQ